MRTGETNKKISQIEKMSCQRKRGIAWKMRIIKMVKQQALYLFLRTNIVTDSHSDR